jgi:hypothetical protein
LKLLVNQHPIPQPDVAAATAAKCPGLPGEDGMVDDAACRAWAATAALADAAPRLVAMMRARATASAAVSVTAVPAGVSPSGAECDDEPVMNGPGESVAARVGARPQGHCALDIELGRHGDVAAEPESQVSADFIADTDNMSAGAGKRKRDFSN